MMTARRFFLNRQSILLCSTSTSRQFHPTQPRCHTSPTSFRRHSHNLIMERLQISKGENNTRVKADVEELLTKHWVLDSEGIQLEKTFYFKTYTKVNDLHNVIAIRCKSKNHHPTMTSNYGSLKVQWTTHNPRGLSSKDIDMAKHCDEQAESIGTVPQGESQKCGPSPPTL